MINLRHLKVMVRLALFVLFVLMLWGLPALAADPTITSLLDAVAKQPDIAASALVVRSAEVRLKQARAELYPNLSAFSSYTSFNSPTNLRPMTPTEVNIASGQSVPFSEDIFRYGLKAEMPIFVKSIYSLADKVKQLQKASKAGHRLRLVTRQAAVVSLDASLAFTSHLDGAIASRLESLRKTRDDLRLGVGNGRIPESELLKVETTLNDLQKQRNDLERQAISLTSQLEQLTGIRLKHFVKLSLKHSVTEGQFLRQTEQQANVAAAEKGLQQARDQHYPSIKLEGVISQNEGEAYNTGDAIDRSYNYLGVSISIPLFNRSLSTSIDQAKIQLQREERRLAQLCIDLAADAQRLREQLPVIARSNKLAQTSLDNNKRLLMIAKVAYRSGRMTTEEYLRFETQVLDAEASLHKTHVDRWQIISQQAVLYGDQLTGVVQ